jgi:hypothetical protein
MARDTNENLSASRHFDAAAVLMKRTEAQLFLQFVYQSPNLSDGNAKSPRGADIIQLLCKQSRGVKDSYRVTNFACSIALWRFALSGCNAN